MSASSVSHPIVTYTDDTAINRAHSDALSPTVPTEKAAKTVILQELLMRRLQRERNHADLFMTHDLRVARYLSHWPGVMYGGIPVETGPAVHVFEAPQHPCTQALLAAIPGRHPRLRRPHIALQGALPDPAVSEPGCVFAPRCPAETECCRSEAPPFRATTGDRRVPCHYTDSDIPLPAGGKPGTRGPK